MESTELSFRSILSRFDKSIESVQELIGFDKIVLDHCIQILQTVKKNYSDKIGRQGQEFFEKNITSFKNIASNNTLKKQYQSIYNQSLVLLVSHFSSSLREIFEAAIENLFSRELSSELNKETIKISFSELKALNLKEQGYLGSLVVQKDASISFQDMQGFQRSINKYFQISIEEKNEDIDNIITSQAFRHCVVHNGSIVNMRLINQLKDAKRRKIKLVLHENEEINFSNKDLEVVVDSMKKYIKNLTDNLLKKFNKSTSDTHIQ